MVEGGAVGFMAGGDGEREGFEGGGGRIARTVFERRAEAERPRFMQMGMKDTEEVIVVAGDDIDQIGWHNIFS